jgi:hypothetical protein
MKLRNLILLASLALASSILTAAPVKLSRENASRLHAALDAIAPGLNPSNAIAAADNLNALEPVANGVRKAAVALQRAQARLPDSPDKLERSIRLVEEFDARAEELMTVDLTPFELSADEIRDAKIAPGNLAVIRRWLQPKK